MTTPASLLDITELTNQANSANGANDWAASAQPYAICPGGTEYYVYAGAAADPAYMDSTVPWILLRKQPGGNWTQIAQGQPFHREKPSMQVDPQSPEDVILFAFRVSMTDLLNSGFPYEYRTRDGQTVQIPGVWYGEPPHQWPESNVDAVTHPYQSSGRMSDGTIVFSRLAYVPGGNPPNINVPGYLQWVLRSPTGQYSPVQQTQFPYRVAYLFWDQCPVCGGLVVSGTRDCLFTELGLTYPGGFSYAFNLIYAAHWTNPLGQPDVQKPIYEVLQTQADGNVWFTNCESVMGADGLWRILGAGHGPIHNQTWFGLLSLVNPHTLAIVQQIDSVDTPALFPIPFQNVTRMQQLVDLTWVYWSYWQDKVYVVKSLDTTGLQMDTVTTITLPGDFASRTSGNQWKPARNGSPRFATGNIIKTILMEWQAQKPQAISLGIGATIPPPPISQPPTFGVSSVGTQLPSSATLQGSVTSDGGSAVTERGFVFSLSMDNPHPSIGGTGVSKVIAGSGTGNFNQLVANLQPGAVYAFKAYAINHDWTAYSNEVTFTQPVEPSANVPILNDVLASNITQTSLVATSALVSDGGAAILEIGFLVTTPNISAMPTLGMTGVTAYPGALSLALAGLIEGSHYVIRAYARNSAGVGYSSPVDVQTQGTVINPPPPSGSSETTALVIGLLVAAIFVLKGKQ